MNETVTIPIQASILNPNDSADITLIADAVSVGTTMRLATGQVVTWTEEAMRKHVNSFVGTPVNVLLGSDGKPTSHSREVVGTIRKAEFDESKKVIRVYASLWGHYYPETISALKELYNKAALEVSMEFLASDLVDNGDGSVTPAGGRFSGMGIVAGGADLGNSVLLLASAMQSDLGTQEEAKKVTTPIVAPVGSFEWIALQAASYLANKGTVDQPYEANIVGTFNNAIVYQHGVDTFRVDYNRDGEKVEFGEPVKVETTYVPLDASRKDAPNTPIASGVENMPNEKEFEELKASHDTLKTEVEELRKIKSDYTELKAQVEKDKAEKEAADKADARIAELEKIRPYGENVELKASHRELLKTADEGTFEDMKKLFASLVELKGGITSEKETPTPKEGDDPETEATLKTWKDELLAQFGKPAPASK